MLAFCLLCFIDIHSICSKVKALGYDLSPLLRVFKPWHSIAHVWKHIAQPHLEYMPPKYGTHTSRRYQSSWGVQKSALRMCSNMNYENLHFRAFNCLSYQQGDFYLRLSLMLYRRHFPPPNTSFVTMNHSELASTIPSFTLLCHTLFPHGLGLVM